MKPQVVEALNIVKVVPRMEKVKSHLSFPILVFFSFGEFEFEILCSVTTNTIRMVKGRPEFKKSYGKGSRKFFKKF